ncbi:MAG: PilZ domain-containing protein [Myxococcota bacterium]|nr:PilZ domain-containing protein [Myxococcota bacterium]
MSTKSQVGDWSEESFEVFQAFAQSDSLAWGEPGLQKPDEFSDFELDDIALPPERIRFATVARLYDKQHEFISDAVLTNISADGLACVSEAELVTGETVIFRFSTDLGADESEFPAEVVWCRYSDGSQEPSYGMRFLELGQGARGQLGQILHERGEGIANEWSMPALPLLEREVRVGSFVSPWLAGAAGLAMGVLLAAGVTFGTDEVISDEAGVNQRFVVKAGAISALESAGEVVSEAVEVDLEVLPLIAGVATAEQKKAESKISAKSEGEPIKSESKLAEKQIDAAANPDTPSQGADKALQDQATHSLPAAAKTLNMENKVNKIEVVEDYGRLKLMIPISYDLGGKPIQTFWLTNPQRLVIDIGGKARSRVGAKILNLHPWVKEVRKGVYPDKLRYVIETTSDVVRRSKVRGNGETITVNLRQRSN